MARILVIDDDLAVRIAIRRMLKYTNHEVVEAPDGKEGVQLYRQKPADLVITNIFMPEKDGLEVIQELRQDFPGVKIIAISGGSKMGDFDFLPMAKELGVLYTLEKPFHMEKLLRAVRGALEQG